MEKKILVAVDGSRHAAMAVRYAVKMADVIGDLRFALVHVQPGISRYVLEEAERDAKVRKELLKLTKGNRDAGTALLDKHRSEMVHRGLDPERIEVKTRPRLIGVADDLIALGQTASYDAILVGRRGIGALQEMVTGSVAANLADNSPVTPIWVVDGEVSGTKVLLAVDGSSRALRAVDHLAFILGGDPSARIHMLHVQPRFEDACEFDVEPAAASEMDAIVLDGDERCMRDFSAQAMSIAARYGFDAHRVEMETLSGRIFAGKAILEAARKGGFGTVVVGRRGESRSPLFGSVSRRVLQRASNLAVWVVP